MWAGFCRAPPQTRAPTIRAMMQRSPSVPTRMRWRGQRSRASEVKGPMMQNGSIVMASTMAIDQASGCCSGDSRT